MLFKNILKKKETEINLINEEDVRTRAYLIWEKSEKNETSEDYWFKAEEEIKQELEGSYS